MIPWIVAHQAPLFMGFPRQEYWSGWPFPSPGDPPNLEIKPMSLILASRLSTTDPQGKSITDIHTHNEIVLTHKKEWNNAICSNVDWLSRASLIAQLVKNLPAMQERPQFNSLVGKIHWRRDRLPTPVFSGFPCGSAGKESTCSVGDMGLIPGDWLRDCHSEWSQTK